jgi:uncharacterized protein YecE (DUF72 family)
VHRLDDLDLNHYHFRGLHPQVRMGTASDRYAGWLGQIYSEDLYTGRLVHRSHKIGGKSFRETVLPVDSLREYFEHFRVLEIDYTFYQPLLDARGTPTQTFQVLKSYREFLAHDDAVILKVPQFVFAQKIRHADGYAANERYLDPEAFTHQFYRPAMELLGRHLSGFIFEQEYQRKAERPPAVELALALSRFFEKIPRDLRYHVELRTESYLNQPVLRVFEEFGIGQVLSHWTWLPPLVNQFAKGRRRFFNAGRESIIRLMTPLGTRYEDAYAQAFPFTKLVEGMLQPGMIDDTAELMEAAIGQDVRINVIINNRAGGNAPRIAQLIADRILSPPRSGSGLTPSSRHSFIAPGGSRTPRGHAGPCASSSAHARTAPETHGNQAELRCRLAPVCRSP